MPKPSLAAAALLAASIAHADVRVSEESRMTMQLMGQTTITTHSVETVAGQRSRRESDVRFEGGLMGMAPKNRSVEIDRLDKGVFWHVDLDRKEYREETYAARKDALAGVSGGGKRWKVVRATAKVVESPETKRIGAWDCRKFAVSLSMELEDLSSGAHQQHDMTTETWMTRAAGDLAKVKAERDAVTNARMKALGFEAGADWAGANARWFTVAGIDVAELASALQSAEKDFAKLSGVAVVTDLEWKTTSTSGTKDSAGGGEEDPMAALAKMMGGGAGGGNGVFLKGRTELKKAEVISAAAAEFEVPAGFRKQER